MELHVDAKVARLPGMRMLLVDVQRLFGRLQIQKLLNMRKVIAEGWFFTLFTNVVRVQASHLVGTGEATVYSVEQKKRTRVS